MSFTVAPAHVLFKDAELRKRHSGVVVKCGRQGRAWDEKTGANFYGLTLSPTPSSSAMHIGVAVAGVCNAYISDENMKAMYLGTPLEADTNGQLKKKADDKGALGIFLDKIGKDTAKVLLTNTPTGAVDVAQVPTFGLGGATTAEGSASKRRRRAYDEQDMQSIYSAIDSARS